MVMIFRYANVLNEDGTLSKTPNINVYSYNAENKLLKINAIIDSGADIMIIPKDLAIILGLELKEETETIGIGGSVKARKTNISINIKYNKESHHINTGALVLMDENIDIPMILGRKTFFDEFEITFKQKQDTIILTKAN